jgi:hypothetical protein
MTDTKDNSPEDTTSYKERLDNECHDGLNLNRAKRCEAVIRRYNDDCDETSNLIDFLADARHWCDHHGLCFADLDGRAHRHYLAEADSSVSDDFIRGPAAAPDVQELPAIAHELLSSLDYLLEQTVDMDLKYGIGLTEGEEDARAKALAVIAKTPRSALEQDGRDLPYSITSVCRNDLLTRFSREQVENLTSADMQMLAEKMEDAYVQQQFWDDLEFFTGQILDQKKANNQAEDES